MKTRAPSTVRRVDEVPVMTEEIYSLEPTDDPPRPIRPPRMQLAEGGTILEDQDCDGCGYNLRGLKASGRCPECGLEITPAAGPIDPDRHAYDDPEDARWRDAPSPRSPPRLRDPIYGLTAPGTRPLATPPPLEYCAKCGYDLRGLPPGGRCPECGQPITPPRVRDEWFDMPQGIIKAFRAGAWLAVMSTTGASGAMLLSGFFGVPMRGRALAVGACAVLWVIASWLLTLGVDSPSAATRGFHTSSRLRLAARWLQAGWLLVALPMVIAGAAPNAPANVLNTAGIAGGFGAVAGVVGLAFMALMLGRIAHWLQDEFAEKAFNWALWGAAVGLPLIVILPVLAAALGGLAVFLFFILGGVAWLLWLIGIVALPLGLFSLARSLDWSMTHRRERENRDEALREAAANAARQPGYPPAS